MYIMASLSFFIALIALLLGAANLMSLSLMRRRLSDKGTDSLLVPYIPLFFMTLAEFLRVCFHADPAYAGLLPILGALSECFRLTLGLAWVHFCHTHYRLNKVVDGRQALTPWFAGVTLLNLGIFGLRFAIPPLATAASEANNVILAVCLFYAGISGILVLRKKNTLLGSSWTGLLVAGISLIVYPLVSLADILHFGYPAMEVGVPIWQQTQPLYHLVVNVPLLVYIVRSVRVMEAEALEPVVEGYDLSAREKEIVRMLLAGESYKSISHTLGISMATVKTHIMNAYGKIGVSSRSELPAALRRKATPTAPELP
jgi:DNA-binding CsgD family transcriptional regulator